MMMARKRKSPVKEIVVESWAQYGELVTGADFLSWAFRGQGDATWPLQSALSRYLLAYQINKQAWRGQEERILRLFRRKSHLLLEHIPDADDSFQWLALMQHHGAPTRLLDLTWSPYVAAFFALERATKDAAVWALFPARISHLSEQTIRGGKVIQPLDMGPWVKGNFERYFLPGDIPFVVTGEPQTMNRRLIAQSGTFAMPGVLDEPLESILADYPNPDNIIVKLTLRTELMRDHAMRELYNMNITHATLFPDLDGLARSLAYELEFHWAFDTRTMTRYSGFE